jgi:hypothetical protein
MSGNVLAWGAVCLLLAGGCGGGDDDHTEDFLGIWMVTGTSTTQCGTAMPDSKPVSLKITITKGTDAPLVISQGDCMYKLDVKGTTATIRSGQTCMVNGFTLTFSGGTFEVNGLNGNFSQTGTAMIGSGIVLQCMYSATGTANKTS